MYPRYINCAFWKCELKPSEHASKTLFNYSKLCVIRFFTKKVHFLSPKHASRYFSNEFSQHYWQESFDRDSFLSQSRLMPMLPIKWSGTHSIKVGNDGKHSLMNVGSTFPCLTYSPYRVITSTKEFNGMNTAFIEIHVFCKYQIAGQGIGYTVL